MRAILQWSFTKLLVVCASWIVVSVAIMVATSYVWLFSSSVFTSDGSGGIGAVSAGFLLDLFIMVSVGPVVVLIIAWIFQRFVRRGAA